MGEYAIEHPLQTDHEIIIFAGPHGAGKDTLEALFPASQPDATRHVRYTTRPPAAGEVQGQTYNFVTQPVFDDMAERGEFIDYMPNPVCSSGVLCESLVQDVREHRFTSMTMNLHEGISLREKLSRHPIAARSVLLFVAPCPKEVMIYNPDMYLGRLAARMLRRGRQESLGAGRLWVAEYYRKLFIDNDQDMVYIANEEGGQQQALEQLTEALGAPH